MKKSLLALMVVFVGTFASTTQAALPRPRPPMEFTLKALKGTWQIRSNLTMKVDDSSTTFTKTCEQHTPQEDYKESVSVTVPSEVGPLGFVLNLKDGGTSEKFDQTWKRYCSLTVESGLIGFYVRGDELGLDISDATSFAGKHPFDYLYIIGERVK